MARAYGTRPSTLLGVRDPLAAYQFDHAVFGLEEAIDGALDRERHRIDMAELDAKGRASVEKSERRMTALLNRLIGADADEPVVERMSDRGIRFEYDLTPDGEMRVRQVGG